MLVVLGLSSQVGPRISKRAVADFEGISGMFVWVKFVLARSNYREERLAYSCTAPGLVCGRFETSLQIYPSRVTVGLHHHSQGDRDYYHGSRSTLRVSDGILHAYQWKRSRKEGLRIK